LAIGESEGTVARRPPETENDSRRGLRGGARGIFSLWRPKIRHWVRSNFWFCPEAVDHTPTQSAAIGRERLVRYRTTQEWEHLPRAVSSLCEMPFAVFSRRRRPVAQFHPFGTVDLAARTGHFGESTRTEALPRLDWFSRRGNGFSRALVLLTGSSRTA
jgi:hypothetical protein